MLPLRWVDANTVTEAKTEVFCRTGIPAELLTDQGSVLVEKLNTTLCSMHQIKHLKNLLTIPKPMVPLNVGMGL